jgi:hypothetical protein
VRVGIVDVHVVQVEKGLPCGMLVNQLRGCFVDLRTVAHPMGTLMAGVLDVLIEPLGKSELPTDPRIGARRPGYEDRTARRARVALWT